jgi:hypothetical protein
MSGLEILAATALIGTGVQVAGGISSAASAKEAAEKLQILKNEQADEILARNKINERTLLDRMLAEGLQIEARAGSSGLLGTSLGRKLRLQDEVLKFMVDSQREARFKADMLRKGADIDLDLASDAVTGTILTGIGTGLTGIARTGAMLRPAGTPKARS